jgi:hypothetical protein
LFAVQPATVQVPVKRPAQKPTKSPAPIASRVGDSDDEALFFTLFFTLRVSFFPAKPAKHFLAFVGILSPTLL